MRGALPHTAAVEVQLKRGKIKSEFTNYRYNVLCHVGPSAAAPLPLRAVSPAPSGHGGGGSGLVKGTNGKAHTFSADAIAAAVANGAKAAGGEPAVVAYRAIPNARLTADVLLVNGVRDAPNPSGGVGVGETGGVCPDALKKALLAALPQHHVVLTWSRDGVADEMDCYAFPKAHMIAGLLAVEADAVEPCRAALLAPGLDFESFVNKAGSMDEDGKKKEDAGARARRADHPRARRPRPPRTLAHFCPRSPARRPPHGPTPTPRARPPAPAGSDEAAMREAHKLWDAGERKEAVLRVIAAKIGLSADAVMSESGRNKSFSELGGNSFAAMGAIGALREQFRISVPVFELLTLTFAQFAASAVAKSDGMASGANAWIIESAPAFGPFRSVSDAHTPRLPTFVFFPMAGGAPPPRPRPRAPLLSPTPERQDLFSCREARRAAPRAVPRFCRPR